MSFWWRRWIEHSRSPSATTLPKASARNCTSMCRTLFEELLDVEGVVAERGRRLAPGDPQGRLHLVVAAAPAECPCRRRRTPPSRAPGSPAGPPPRAPRRSWRRVSSPGTTGTPASAASRRAAILSPRSRIVCADGPMKAMPAAVAGVDEGGVLRQKAVAGMDRFDAASARAASMTRSMLR